MANLLVKGKKPDIDGLVAVGHAGERGWNYVGLPGLSPRARART
jgi:hypothetical protein